jgi:hypothetical protein
MLPRTSAASAEAAAVELEEAELQRLESGTKVRGTKARARGGGGGAKVRFYLSKEKMKRIFAKYPEVQSHNLEEVHGQGLPRKMFWDRYCHAAAHRKRSLRCEAGQTASGCSSGKKGRKSGRKCSGQQVFENRVSRPMPRQLEEEQAAEKKRQALVQSELRRMCYAGNLFDGDDNLNASLGANALEIKVAQAGEDGGSAVAQAHFLRSLQRADPWWSSGSARGRGRLEPKTLHNTDASIL